MGESELEEGRMEVEIGREASERNLDCLRIQLVETDGKKVALR